MVCACQITEMPDGRNQVYGVVGIFHHDFKLSDVLPFPFKLLASTYTAWKQSTDQCHKTSWKLET